MAETEQRDLDASAMPFGIGRVIATLAPLIAGLAFARTGLMAASYGSYRASDEGILTDGAMIVSLLILLVPFALVTAKRIELSPHAARRLALACIVAEAASVFGSVAAETVGVDFSMRFALSVVCTLSSSGTMFYWLRAMRGTGTVYAVTFVFSALVLSEAVMLVTATVPRTAGVVLAGVLSLVQIPLVKLSQGRATPFSKDQLTKENAFPGFDDATLKSAHLLVIMAVSIGLLAVATGFLRGYPEGASIPLSLGARIAYAVLASALSVLTVALAVGKHKQVMPVGFFVMLELLACAALVCYAAFPASLDIGAAFSTTLNALTVGLAWYIVVAFSSFGWRDPYYYAMAGWFVWLGARACVRCTMLILPDFWKSDALIIAVTATIVVVSTQATLVMFLSAERRHDALHKEEAPSGALMRVMGLDNAESLSNMKQASVRRSAEIMGGQFLLSDREIDVLALYALGFTQKKVGEELYISPNTAHAHIKRIYTKTGLHSRQEILDYMEQYAS